MQFGKVVLMVKRRFAATNSYIFESVSGSTIYSSIYKCCSFTYSEMHRNRMQKIHREMMVFGGRSVVVCVCVC